MVFQNSTGSNAKYWLGSRSSCVSPYIAYFGVYYVSEGGVGCVGIVNSSGGEGVYCVGVRPLVSLQSNIKLELAEDGSWNISAS